MFLSSHEAAVVLIDLQRAFLASDGSMARQGHNLDRCRSAMSGSSSLATSAKEHGVPVLWTRFVLRDDHSDGGVLTDVLRPGLRRVGALRASTPDVELFRQSAAHQDTVIDKPRYSAFFAPSFETALHSLGVRSLIFGGVTSSMCVESTARDAAQRDYQVFVAEDACGDFDEQRHRAAMSALAFGFAVVASVADIVSGFGGAGAELTPEGLPSAKPPERYS